MKRIQNIVAESRRTLSITATYAIIVWLLAGLIGQGRWLQFACFVLSVYLMMLLNNENLLIRIYSRMVSVSYILLSCAALFLFDSLSGAFFQPALIASIFCLFKTYQDRSSAGWTYYTFLFLGLGSLLDVHALYLLPVFWLMMMLTVYSFSWRTLMASLLGIATPYWFTLAWYAWQGEGDISPWLLHFTEFASLQQLFSYSGLSLQHLLLIVFLVSLFLLGAIHFVVTSYMDKIRVRQMYYSLIVLMIFSCILVALLPQLYHLTFHIMIISVSPIIGHFMALTNSRLTNILFFVLAAVTLFLTSMNLWIS